MALYQSSTRRVPLTELPAPLLAALREHAARNQLVLDGARCWLTHSVNPPSESFFGKMFGRRANTLDPDAESDTAVVLHSTHLVIANAGAQRGAAALSLPLVQASIGQTSALAAAVGSTTSEPGMAVAGLPGEHGRPGTYFVKLGEDEAGAECRREVEAAVVSAKNR